MNLCGILCIHATKQLTVQSIHFEHLHILSPGRRKLQRLRSYIFRGFRKFLEHHIVKRKCSRGSARVKTQAAIRICCGRHLEFERIGLHICAELKILLFREVRFPRVIMLLHVDLERTDRTRACIKTDFVPLALFKVQIVLDQLHLVILRTDGGNIELVLSIFRITSRSGIAM